MNVIRDQYVTTDEVRVGDRMILDMGDLGTFDATIHKVEGNQALIIFDGCVAEMPMNKELYNWLDGEFKSKLPDWIRDKVLQVTIPTYGMIFGHDEFYKNFKPDEDEQLPLMRKRRNRVADYNDDYEWWWLQNKAFGSTNFAVVNTCGNTNYTNASNTFGVRPAIYVLVR